MEKMYLSRVVCLTFIDGSGGNTGNTYYRWKYSELTDKTENSDNCSVQSISTEIDFILLSCGANSSILFSI